MSEPTLADLVARARTEPADKTLPIMKQAMLDRGVPVAKVVDETRKGRVVVHYHGDPNKHEKHIAEHLAQPHYVFHVVKSH